MVDSAFVPVKKQTPPVLKFRVGGVELSSFSVSVEIDGVLVAPAARFTGRVDVADDV